MRPPWGTLAVISALALIAFTLMAMDWSDPRPVAEFGELLVAHLLYLAVLGGALAAAFAIAAALGKRVRATWPLVIAGIAVFFLVNLVGFAIAAKIPGVGWRIEQLLQSEDG